MFTRPTKAAVSPEGTRSRGTQSLEVFLEDLSTLLALEWALYISVGPKGAILSIKSLDATAFGDAVAGRWVRMTPKERAHFVVTWIRRAAAYCRDPKIHKSSVEQSVA